MSTLSKGKCSRICCVVEERKKMENKKTTFFIGLFDKNTKKQEMITEQAVEIIKSIANTYFKGATVWTCQGLYKHVDGSEVAEPSIACMVYNITSEQREAFCQKAKTLLNQECIAVDTVLCNVEFI